MIKPENYTVEQKAEDSATISFTLSDSLFYLKGHFPAQPLLPGVVQLGWACELAEDLLKAPGAFKGVRALKFIAPMLPHDDITLKLDLDRSKKSLKFTYSIRVAEALKLSSQDTVMLEDK